VLFPLVPLVTLRETSVQCLEECTINQAKRYETVRKGQLMRRALRTTMGEPSATKAEEGGAASGPANSAP
jgi:hypothetical protein